MNDTSVGSAPRRRRVATAAALVLVLVLAACTDDGAEEGTAPAHPDAVATTTGPPAVERTLATTTETADDLPGFNVRRPVDLDAAGRSLPVVVWGNGGCVRHDATWSTLLDRWAAAGFVVISITESTGRDARSAPSHTADDQAAAIDWAEAEAADPTSTLGPHLDLDRVVAAGNSCGGVTSLALASEDDRVATVFVLSGSSVAPGAGPRQAAEVMTQVSAPVGFAVGGPEDIAARPADQDLDVLSDGVPGFVAHRDSGDHVLVSTDEAILAEVAEIGLRWFDLALYGPPPDADDLRARPCEPCPADRWTVRARSLDRLPVV